MLNQQVCRTILRLLHDVLHEHLVDLVTGAKITWEKGNSDHKTKSRRRNEDASGAVDCERNAQARPCVGLRLVVEIEPHRRGPYAGAVGYIDFSGNLDTAIALRTLVAADGKAWVQAGAGIVADSDPGREYEECLNKAAAVLAAVAGAADV